MFGNAISSEALDLAASWVRAVPPIHAIAYESHRLATRKTCINLKSGSPTGRYPLALRLRTASLDLAEGSR